MSAIKTSSAWTIRLLAVPVTVKPTFFLVVALLGSGRLPNIAHFFVWVAVATLSVLWHEFGHVIALRAFGCHSTVELWSFGGLTHPQAEQAADRPLADAIVSLAGPAAGLLLGWAVSLVSITGTIAPSSALEVALDDLLWVNIGWSLINLAPILPLDGGRVLAAALRGGLKRKEGNVTYAVSLVTASVGVLVGLLQRDYWIAFLALWMGGYNAQRLVPSRGAAAEEQAPPQTRRIEWMDDALAALEGGDLKDAGRIAKAKLESPQERRLHARAASILMWVHLIGGRLPEAAAIADNYLSQSLVLPVIHPSIAGATAGTDTAIDLLGRAFSAHPSQATARLFSAALVESKRLDEAKDLLFDDRAQPIQEITARLVHLAFVQQARWEEAAQLGSRLLDTRADPLIAYNTACSCARINRNDEALRWLEKAIDAGFTDAEQIDSDPDLEPLRIKAAYVRVRDKLEIRA